MTSWFRSWHGAPTDMKWRTIAKRAGVPSGYVTAIVWVLLDRASQADERGSIAGYDAEEIAVALDFDPEQVEAVIAAMRDKGVLDGDTFTGWAKHQPGREDNSAERVKRHRARSKQDVTQCNAPVTQCNAPETDTDTDTDTEEASASSDAGASANRAHLRNRLVFESHDDLVALGINRREAPGMIGRWLRSTNDDEARVLEAIARARDQRAHEPVAFITARLKENHHERNDRNNVVSSLRRLGEKFDAME